MTQKIEINNYEVQVNLGCYPDEKLRSQPVRFSVRLQFESLLKCADTDKLEDAIDYVRITDIIKETAMSRHYSLVENLNASVAGAVTTYLKSTEIRGQLSLHTAKIQVPVEGLMGAVTVSCETRF